MGVLSAVEFDTILWHKLCNRHLTVLACNTAFLTLSKISKCHENFSSNVVDRMYSSGIVTVQIYFLHKDNR